MGRALPRLFISSFYFPLLRTPCALLARRQAEPKLKCTTKLVVSIHFRFEQPPSRLKVASPYAQKQCSDCSFVQAFVPKYVSSHLAEMGDTCLAFGAIKFIQKSMHLQRRRIYIYPQLLLCKFQVFFLCRQTHLQA